jgi:hypothetical protein
MRALFLAALVLGACHKSSESYATTPSLKEVTLAITGMT